MKSFLIKILLYLVVMTSIYVFPISLYFITKDYFSIEKIVKIQESKSSTLIGFSYFGGREVAYKTLLLNNKKPDIIVFGSSRTFQIQKDFFIKPKSFVNAAVPRPSIGNLLNLQDLINTLPQDGKKRVLFLLLDKRYFTERYAVGSDIKENSLFLKLVHLVGKPLRLVYIDYMTHKYSLRDLVQQSRISSNIGLWALIKDSGYKADGSYREGYEMNIPNRKETLITQISGRVLEIQDYSSELLSQEEKNIPQNLEDLKSILALCKKRNITVIAFIPPDPVEVAQEIHKNSSPYAQSQNSLVRNIATIFSESKFIFLDLSDSSIYGGKNEEFIDLIHGGDLVYAKMLLYLATHANQAKEYIDISGIQNMIRTTKGDFIDP